jgi:hypothetical protein
MPAERQDAAGFARYAARLYPAAGVAELRALAGMLTWFFLFDDAIDGRAALTLDDVRATVDGAGAVPAPAEPMRRMLVGWWRAITGDMPDMARSRLYDAVRHHLDGILVEAANKWVGRRPGIAEYVQLCRATSGAYVSYALIGFANRDRIPDAVFHHPALREAGAAANDLLSWFNDLLSLERDEATSGGHNLVLATARQRGLARGTAVREVTRRWQERMVGFLAVRAAAPTFGPPVDAAVRRYLQGLADSVRGTIDWTLESPRYPIRPPVEAWLVGL